MFLGAVVLPARSDTTLKNKIGQDLDTKITWNWYDRVVAGTIEIMSKYKLEKEDILQYPVDITAEIPEQIGEEKKEREKNSQPFEAFTVY